MSSLVKTHGSVLLIIALLHHLLLHPFSVAQQWSPQSSPLQAAVEEKIRLGSMPPSCHNRCNTCSPCDAVEIPTLPGPSGRPAPGELRQADQAAYSQYNSNYKPLGWKCRCSGRVYNP